MSLYYSYEFVSAQSLMALVSEELKSYLDSGAVDNLVWSIYIDKCLKKLGKGSYDIKPVILNICDFEARLPDDFFAVREAWLCTNITQSYQLPSADYQEVTAQSTSIALSHKDSYCSPCAPDIIKAVYKTTHQAFAYYRKHYLLKPGNIWAKGECHANCKNFGSAGPESFDVRDNKFVVTFRQGNVYMLYYSKEYDDDGYQMIPDNFRIQEYIEAFIKQKVFEQLSNQIVDETTNQIQQKAQYYKQLADEAFIIAVIETRKEDIYTKHRKIVKSLNNLNQYEIR